MAYSTTPGDILNRILALLLGIAVALVGLGLLVEPSVVVVDADSLLASLRASPEATVQEAAIIAIILGLVILLIEILPRHRPTHVVAQIDGCIVEYTVPLVADVIERDIRDLDGIQEVHARIQLHGQKVDAASALIIAPGFETQTIVGRVSSRMRDRISQLGLEPGRLQLSICPDKSGVTSSTQPSRSVA